MLPQPVKINDGTRGITIAVPGRGWYVQSNSYDITAAPLDDSNVLVYIRENYSKKLTAAEIYDDERNEKKIDMPGAQFMRENEKIDFPGGVQAVSMTFKDPSVLEIKRQLFFIHRGERYQMEFSVPEAKLASYKEDFSLILKSLAFFEPTQAGMEVVHPQLGARASTPNGDKGWYVQADERAFDLIFKNPKSYKKEVVITMEFQQFITGLSLQSAYEKRAADIKGFLPGAQFVVENQKMQIGGTTEALSITYKDLSKSTVHRVLVFLRQGNTQEFRFSIFDSVFEKYKPDLSIILKNMKIE